MHSSNSSVFCARRGKLRATLATAHFARASPWARTFTPWVSEVDRMAKDINSNPVIK
jgi:hypothetical protein